MARDASTAMFALRLPICNPLSGSSRAAPQRSVAPAQPRLTSAECFTQLSKHTGAVVPGGERLGHIDADKAGRRVRLHLPNKIHVGRNHGPEHEVAAAGDSVAVQYD